MKRLRRWISGILLCTLLMTAAAAPASAASVSFRDVPAGHWAASYIERAVQMGLVNGETATTFGLGHPMTRAAFTVVLCRLFGWETQTPEKGSFEDNQDPSAWYYSAVETACANGAVPRQNSLFRPADPVTREEMTVALIRALGYTTLAGLDQGLSCPFEDVETNKGYLTMAYYLGISGGTSATTFSPDQTATREQAVAMLMRVYDRLHAPAAERIGVVSASAEPEEFFGCAVVAVSGARLTTSGTVIVPTDDEPVKALRESIRASGAKTLLKVDGSQTVLGANTTKGIKTFTTAAVSAITAAAEEYDGVLLDISKVPPARKNQHTALITALKDALDEKLLYVAAEAPACGTEYGYDYAALSACADKLILRAASYTKEVNGFPTAPQEPLEEVYYALAALKGQVDLSKCSLWLSTTGLSRTDGKSFSSMPAESIYELLQDPSARSYYSTRYAEAYLSCTANRKRTVVWFHDQRAAEARTQLYALFGVNSICLSSLTSVADYEGYSILSGLEAEKVSAG